MSSASTPNSSVTPSLTALTSFDGDRVLCESRKHLYCPNWLWSWCFITALRTLTKTRAYLVYYQKTKLTSRQEKHPYSWNKITLNVGVSDIITLRNILGLRELFHGPGSNRGPNEIPRINHLVCLHHHYRITISGLFISNLCHPGAWSVFSS